MISFLLHLPLIVIAGLLGGIVVAVWLVISKVTDLVFANRHLRQLESLGTSDAALDSAGSPKCVGPVSRALTLYGNAFVESRRARWLPQFSVDQHLANVRATPSATVLPLKAVAGVMILCGLLFTLLQLQGAVTNLGTAFDSLATGQEVHTSEDTLPQGTGVDDQQQFVIKSTMAKVAGAAGSAFRVSLIFIFLAAVLLAMSIVLQFSASRVVQRYSSWAYGAYNSALPMQLPVSQTDAAARLADSLKALDKLVVAFDGVATKLNTLDHFSSTMEEARKAIVEAMEKLPDHIRSSVSSLSTDVVAGLSRNMEESTLATKQILAIYGEQEFRIQEVAEHVAAVRGFTERSTVAFEPLKQLPAQLNTLITTLQQNEKVAVRIDHAVSTLAKNVEDLPISQLRTALERLQASEGDLVSIAKTLGTAAEQVKATNGQLATELRGIATSILSAQSSIVTLDEKSTANTVAVKTQLQQLAKKLLAESFTGTDALGSIQAELTRLRKSGWSIRNLFSTAGASE